MRIAVTVSLCLCASLASTIPAGAQCPPDSIGRLAIQIIQPGELTSNQPLNLESRGKKFVARSSPELTEYWIYSGTSWFEKDAVKNVRPTAACVRFTQADEPYPDRLKDGKCYWVLKFKAESLCWTLRVESDPLGYPFRVTLGGNAKPKPVRQEVNDDSDWNLERDLPRNAPATVEILDKAGGQKPILAIEVRFARLLGMEELKVPKSAFSEYPVEAKLPLNDDARRAVQKNPLTAPVSGLLELHEIRLRAERQP